MKKILGAVCAAGIIISSSITGVSGVSAASLSQNDKEVEDNNSKETAQDLKLGEFQGEEATADVLGNFSTESDQDWYEVTLPSRGVIEVDFYEENDDFISHSDSPYIDMFSTRKDGIYGNVQYYEGITDFEKYGIDGKGFIWGNHLPDNKLFIRLKDDKRFKTKDYHMKLTFTHNRVGDNDPLEPNTYFSNEYHYYEMTPIKEGELVTSKWNSSVDYRDNFSINPSSNKGTLSFEVHHTDKEIEYFNFDNHTRYDLYAETNSGTYEMIDAVIPQGIPNKIVKDEVEVNNSNYTGKYVLMVENSRFIDSYQVKMDFEDKSSNELEPDPKPEPEPDTQAPGEVKNLKVNHVSESEITFEYTLPSEEDFDHVNVLRNGHQVDTSNKSTFTDQGLSPNTKYTYTIKTVDEKGNESKGVTKSVTTQKHLERISGTTRYKTASAFANKVAPHSLGAVFIASGKNYPDALAGGVLNHSNNGMVLLVQDKGDIVTHKINEVKRLLKKGGKVYILGGPGAVSEKIKKQFERHFSVERIAGNTRVKTAIEIANKVDANPNEIFVSYGFNFADALAIVPYASEKEIPVLLNGSKKELSSELKNYIQTHPSIKKVTIIGGPGVVSQSSELSLKQMVGSVERVSSTTRELTALAIAKKYYGDTNKVAISNGQRFPDSLSGSRFAFKNGMPILLVTEDKMKPEVRNFAEKADSFYFFGGSGVISDQLKNSLK
ncbi:cell wall-binding repeat-containing protein [Halobacillus salinarum]|uniref:Cell wall-binding repeat-containing protein n=1 Tax=Halobacillus salinarum TaxID=2932257 RepID=A0ABY4EMI5_9BACI|nr:cell wall-binding repeat-containing protein [Halobacillus salinarum]UOQ44822.1 cell wall-binding repeat-containing protein [Halobacillus salinarum]